MASTSPEKQKRQQASAACKQIKQSTDARTTTRLIPGRVFEFLLAFRLLNALSTRTFFQPDEYYQTLEPAWRVAFGEESHAWITWEWHAHLRSSLHPALFATAYRIVDLLADYLSVTPSMRAELLFVSPKIIQAVIASLGDLYTWKLAQRVYGSSSSVAFAALALTVLNPWQWFCSTRTFSNGLETTLTVIALCYWPFSAQQFPWASAISARDNSEQIRGGASRQSLQKKSSSLRPALIFAALATLLRPTNIIIWASLTIYTFLPKLTTPSPQPSASKTVSNRSQTWIWPTFADLYSFSMNVVGFGALALIVSLSGDYYFYKQLTFPPLNFLIFNVVKSLAVFYGNNDWHYYLSQGYPLLLTTALPFTLIGMYNCMNIAYDPQLYQPFQTIMLRGLCIISITLPAALSVLSHKEVRFIYPLLPAFHVLAASPFSDFFGPILWKSDKLTSLSTSARLTKRMLLGIFLLINATIAIYTTQIHNSGILSIPKYLRTEYETYYTTTIDTQPSSTPMSMTVAFLMPCHSVPWRSHIQYPPSTTPGIKAWALTCEPPLHITNSTLKAKYRDEADLFYDDPTSWVKTNMARSKYTGQLDNRGTHARIEPDVYTNANDKKKKLWSQSSSSASSSTRGIDIIDLLPSLSTFAHSSDKQAQLQNLAVTGQSPRSNVRREWPHYLVFFAHLEPLMSSVLKGSGYRECWRSFNSHWHDDWRRTGDVLVWCLRSVVDHQAEDDMSGDKVTNGETRDGVERKGSVMAEGANGWPRML